MKRHFTPPRLQAAVAVSILALIVSSAFSWAQLRQAATAELREAREQSLSYKLEQVQSHYTYQISYQGSVLECPAPSSRIKVQTGALRCVTAITFDGVRYGEIAALPIERDWDGYSVEVAVPPLENPPVENDQAYDYYFLYLEPMSGEPVLDLVFHKIDLALGQVTSGVVHRTALLELDTLEESPRKAMLSAYAALYAALDDLPVQAAA